jgi:hypothetical protein
MTTNRRPTRPTFRVIAYFPAGCTSASLLMDIRAETMDAAIKYGSRKAFCWVASNGAIARPVRVVAA